MSVLFPVLVYFDINWLGMLDNGGFFDIQKIVPQLLTFLAGKMAKNGSKLAQKRAFFKKRMQSHP